MRETGSSKRLSLPICGKSFFTNFACALFATTIIFLSRVRALILSSVLRNIVLRSLVIDKNAFGMDAVDRGFNLFPFPPAKTTAYTLLRIVDSRGQLLGQLRNSQDQSPLLADYFNQSASDDYSVRDFCDRSRLSGV